MILSQCSALYSSGVVVGVWFRLDSWSLVHLLRSTTAW